MWRWNFIYRGCMPDFVYGYYLMLKIFIHYKYGIEQKNMFSYMIFCKEHKYFSIVDERTHNIYCLCFHTRQLEFLIFQQLCMCFFCNQFCNELVGCNYQLLLNCSKLKIWKQNNKKRETLNFSYKTR